MWRSFAIGVVLVGLLVGCSCPKPTGSTNRSGFHQVIRTPIRHGASYGDATNGTSITITIPGSGRVAFQCS